MLAAAPIFVPRSNAGGDEKDLSSYESPLRGFGGVVALYPTDDSGLYLKAGMFTSLSDDTGSTIADFFTKNEHFYMLEIGSTALARTGTAIQTRGPTDADNVHITSWYRNATNASPRSYGFAFNANRRVGERFMWFLRGGWSKEQMGRFLWDLVGALRKREPISSVWDSVGLTHPVVL